MYLRFSQRANADGTVVRYVALAHNRRVDGKVKPDVLMNLGRVDRLDVDGLLRLAASIRKHFGDESGLTDSAGAGETTGAAPMAVVDARPIGTTWLLDALWARLEIGTSIKRIADGRRFTTAVERVLFALVCDRAIAPMSKLSAAEWATEDVVIPGLAGMDDDQAYRAMDLLVAADTQGRVQEAVCFAVANLLNLESTCCSSTPPRPTSSATPKTRTSPARVMLTGRAFAATASPKTTVMTCPRS